MNQGKPEQKRHLLGLGLDNEDGHKRITKGAGFTLLGGSEETHERMTETVLKTVETLDRRGRTLHTAEVEELSDVLQSHAG